MLLNTALTYNYSNNEAVRKSEEILKFELGELVKEIEVNELVHGIGFNRPFTSILATKNDAQILANERKYYIERLLNVHDVHPLYIQADVMREQVEASNQSEYSTPSQQQLSPLSSLSLLLHQFYLDRISHCVQAKHAHLLRWRRFAEHSSSIEDAYSSFKSRLAYIMSEYSDSCARSSRLSQSRDFLLSMSVSASTTTSSSSNVVTMAATALPEDVEIYLRWLIAHTYALKGFLHAMKLIEWSGYMMSIEARASSVSAATNEDFVDDDLDSSLRKSILINPEDSSPLGQSTTNMRSSNLEANTVGSILNTRFKKSDNVFLSSTNPHLPRNETINSISFLFNQDKIPMHNNSIEFLRPRLRYFISTYKIDYNLSRMQTAGDEMELFAAVNRKFRHLFNQQEHMKKFRVYDILEVGTENWGADSPIHALKKEANWLEFIQIVPMKDYIYEREMAKIRFKSVLDEFILPHKSFLEIGDYERVQEILRENSTLIRNPPAIKPLKTGFGPNGQPSEFNTHTLWKKIFQSTSPSQKEDDLVLRDQSSSSSANRGISFRSRSNRNQDEFNFTENLQKLGLDDSNSSDQNLSNVQGSYLSFLMLRHLRIRDLKRVALSYLNYFRSVEKTLTIFDGGLSAEAKNFKRQSPQNHVKETPYGSNLGYHAYLFNNPKDFKISETEFMEYEEIENHDDYYTLDEETGQIHVQDQRGYFIVYDVALTDLKKLERELLQVGTYYIAKDREMVKLQSSLDMRRRKTAESSGDLLDINLGEYSHQNVDRFAVLLDLWTNEVNFLEMKKLLFDIYFEAYQNVFDKAERRKIAQIMTNTMHKRVRYDLSSEYFTSSYRNEINCLYKQSQIVKIILERMIDDMRSLSDKLDGDRKFGMPYSVIKKNLIFLTPNSIGATLKNMHLLEFHPCLAAVSRLPSSLDRCIEELAYFMQANTVNERIRIELSYYNRIITKLQSLDPPGSSFTPHIQKEIFSGVFIEDPQLMTDFVESNLKQFEEANKNKTKKEQTEFLFNFMAKLLEIITLRHRLLEAAMETEQLAIVYRKLATEMGFEEYHMYMRYVQLDFAKRKEDAGQPPPLFVSDIGPDDIQIDRYIPNQLCLAINELDESQIGKFSFRGKEALSQILKPGGVENLQLILKLQLSHNNALIAAILQSHSCLLNLSPGSQIGGSIQTIDSSQAKISESKVKFEERLNSTNVFSQMSMNSSVNANSSTKPIATFKFKQYADAFVSIQLEKNPYRDLMLNEYLEQKEKKSSVLLTSPTESEKLKRSLMNTFADRFCIKVRQYSLRAQLIAIYNSITRLLDNFPNTRANHFVFGEPNERRQYLSLMSEHLIDKGDDSLAAKKEDDNQIRPDARIFKSRPRKLLSDDGERVLNIWFIPHYTDLLTVFKKSSDEMALRALLLSVRIMGALNDCLQFMLANAVMTVTLGKASATGKLDLSSWENAGGLDSELNDIQLEINQLDSMGTSPEQVATLLEAKRTNMFSQYECAVRFAVRDIFLASGKVDSFKTVSDNIHFALKFLNDYSIDSHNSVYFDLPEILDARDSVSKELFPWRTSISKNGPFPLKYWPWYLIEPNVSLCLQGLNDIDKNTANGEILGMTLLMEDVLNLNPDEKTPPPPPNAEPAKPDLKYLATRRMTRASVISLTSNRNRASSVMSNNSTKVTATITTNNGGATLLQNYAKWHHFLITWKRCELLKLDWGRRKLGVESINTHYLYEKYCDTYKKEVLLPVFKILVKNTQLKDTYENFIDFNQPIVLPNQISELESKSKQIVRLLEKLELSMIDESLQRVQKDLKQVLAERGREESTLATDLWKKPIMKEEFTVNKPHIVSEFTQMLFKSLEKTTNSNPSELSTDSSKTCYVVDEESLKACLIRLGCLVQERERSNFEQYTLFYETLLRQQHQLLYNRERECRSLKSLLDQKCDEINAEVECQMADTCYDLIMEVTALRARLQQIEMSREAIEKELRDKVKGEFIDLVQDLVSVNTKLKAQLDYFKETIYGDVLELLQNSRFEAFTKIITLKNKFHLPMDDLVNEEKQNRDALISRLQESNTNAAKLLLRYNVIYKLSMNRLQSNLSRRLTEVTDKMDWHKRREVSHRVANELQNVLVVQQNTALKRQLAKLDAEFNSLKAQLDKELKEKEAKEHVLQQRLKKEKNLESAKRSNVEKLLQELEIKDMELQNLQELADKAAKLSIQESTKTQRELSNLRKSLVQERHLKLDAFHLVDDLQGQIYDLETLENMNFKSSQSELSKNEGSTKNLTISQSLASTRMSSLPYSRLYYEKKQSGARPKTTIGRQRESNKPKETVSTEIYQETVTRIRDVRLKSAKQ